MPDQWDSTSRDFIEGREDMVVNNYAQYCSVVKTSIGKSKLVIGGEVDAGKHKPWSFYENVTECHQCGTANLRKMKILSIGWN